MKLRGLVIPKKGALEWRKVSGYWQGKVRYTMQPLLGPPSPHSTTKTANKGAGGLARGGKLAVCILDLALRCVLFGLHNVLKET